MYIDQEARDKINLRIAVMVTEIKLRLQDAEAAGNSTIGFINSIPVYDSPEFKEAPL